MRPRCNCDAFRIGRFFLKLGEELRHVMSARVNAGISFRSISLVVAFNALVMAAVFILLSGATEISAQGKAQKPITISEDQALYFGTVGAVPAATGTAVLDPQTGAKTVTGGAIDLGGVHTLASFSVTGEKNVTFTIILPGTITITELGGSTTTITNFTSFPNTTGTFSAQGQATLVVGATLQVAAGQPSGTYADVFDVTVTY